MRRNTCVSFLVLSKLKENNGKYRHTEHLLLSQSWGEETEWSNMNCSLLLLSVIILLSRGRSASVKFKTDTKKIIMAETEARPRPRLDTFRDRPRVAPRRTTFNKTHLSRNSEKFSSYLRLDYFKFVHFTISYCYIVWRIYLIFSEVHLKRNDDDQEDHYYYYYDDTNHDGDYDDNDADQNYYHYDNENEYYYYYE